MHPFPQLAQRVFNTPIAIHPGKAEVIVAALAERLGVASVRFDGAQLAASSLALDFAEAGDNPRGGYEVHEGVAVIPIRGTTVQRLGTLTPFSGMTGYDGVRQNYMTALTDPAVRGIAFDIDSPGGEVAGCFDLADTIWRARGHKTTWAILSENAYSAAYALASSADRIIVPRTGGTGSVGVIYAHVSYQDFLEDQGVEVTLVTKGALKGETSEFKNLSGDTLKRLKADVRKVGAIFDATVARNRGISARAVDATEAGTFLGQDGVKIGFADEVMAPDEAFRALLEDLD